MNLWSKLPHREPRIRWVEHRPYQARTIRFVYQREEVVVSQQPFLAAVAHVQHFLELCAMPERGRVGVDEQKKQVVRPGAAAEGVHCESVRLERRKFLGFEIGFRRIWVIASKRDADNFLQCSPNSGGGNTALGR